MARIAAQLARRWKAKPQVRVNAVVHTTGDVDRAVTLLQERGLTVRRRYRLLPAIAVSGSAQQCLALADEDWVITVEEDRQVHTM